MAVKGRPVCVPDVALESRVPARTRHDGETVARHLRVLTVTARIGAAVGVFFGIQGLIVGQDVLWIPMLNLASGAIFLMIPLLYRFGELVAPLVFFFVAYTSITVLSLAPRHRLGSALLLLGRGDPHGADPRRRAHRCSPRYSPSSGATTVIVLAIFVPYNTGVQPDWAFTLGFGSSP